MPLASRDETKHGTREEIPEKDLSGNTSLGRLISLLREMQTITVLLSGGVDSACLAWAAARALPKSAVQLLTLTCPLVEEEERRIARQVASQLGLSWHLLEAPTLKVPEVRENSPRRCYFCRKAMHARADAWIREQHKGPLADGVHGEDRREYRPGLQAAEEDGIRHPLEEAGLSKEEIRECLRREGFSHWDRPPRPCLATRFPPGVILEEQNLLLVQRGEELLRGHGFFRGRLRFFPPGAGVLELPEEDLFRALEQRKELTADLLALGFGVIALDLEGHCRGKMERFYSKDFP
jgi:uncharacterized protein